MKVFMIGGTGLLGSEAAKELIRRGHEVSSLALPPLPQGAVLPPEMKLEFGNYLEMSDEELKKHLQGCEGFVFAALLLLGAPSVFQEPGCSWEAGTEHSGFPPPCTSPADCPHN